MSKKHSKSNEYKIANEIFLERKSLEEGVTVLESGIIMRRLEKGNGTKSPQLNSIVFVRYTGRLIDGTVFDSTDGEALPACFRVRELIIGWQAALLRMHEGDTYEIFIPARYGYGSMRLDDIPAWSTLCFTLTLEKIQQ
ncbi:MAG: FKBP-type peptidyl-prolyl cis-trans isomerase [Bacteroidia bacterium]|nr:FKBP-type peptidyl-prolyl cis-trans isomerase [Bacteroidia bacterium]